MTDDYEVDTPSLAEASGHIAALIKQVEVSPPIDALLIARAAHQAIVDLFLARGQEGPRQIDFDAIASVAAELDAWATTNPLDGALKTNMRAALVLSQQCALRSDFLKAHAAKAIDQTTYEAQLYRLMRPAGLG